MSRFAFGLRYFLFALGSALNTREHVIWSIDLIQDCLNLCRAVCAILITPTHSNWTAPFGMDRRDAFQLAICRARSSSNLIGLLYPSAEWRRLAL
jgi:hypothetical protein